ncbi:MAG: xanthine dehydrogenase family protein molybdopterin-binding subunit [Nitrososphaerales archaeon]
MKWVGQSVKRVEDPRFITGRAIFLDDIKLPRMCSMKLLRSPYARARIKKIDASKALELPGVLMVLTGKDLVERKIKTLKPFPLVKLPLKLYSIALDNVHYSGEPVAAVVAEDRYIAEDALDLIEVEYEPLAPILDPESALKSDSPLVFEEGGSNVLFHETFVWGDVEGAFREADFVVETEIRLQRYTSTPIEKHGAIASFDSDGRLTIYDVNHVTGRLIEDYSDALDLPTSKITVIMPDVGGSYGNRNNKRNAVNAAIVSRVLGRPVKWVETECEAFSAAGQSCNSIFRVKAAVKSDGRVLAMKIIDIEDEGGFPTLATLQLLNKTSSMVGCYKIRAISFEGTSVMTNKCPSIANRGIGKPGMTYIVERLMDRVADRLKMDPARIRQINFIQPHEFPYATPRGSIYDSGNYPELLRRAMELADYNKLRSEQAELARKGKYIGIGLAASIQASVQGVPGAVPSEATTMRIDSSGKIIVLHGSGSTGQGHETALAQVVADELGVDMSDVEVVPGLNSDTHPHTEFSGVYTDKFHCTDVGSAIQAARKMKGIIAKIAASKIGAREEDLVFENGRISAQGKSITLIEIASEASRRPDLLSKIGIDSGLNVTSVYVFPYFRPEISTHYTFSSSVHIPIVSVDTSTGKVEVIKYVIVEDCGTLINPMLAEGQLHGSALHGISAALREEFIYDEEGQLVTQTYMDYLKPTIKEMPTFLIDHVITPSPYTATGAKGVGESGAIPAPAAIASAVEDALKPFGVKISELPVRPHKIMEWIWQSR